jgi:hypothetical protein
MSTSANFVRHKQACLRGKYYNASGVYTSSGSTVICRFLTCQTNTITQEDNSEHRNTLVR